MDQYKLDIPIVKTNNNKQTYIIGCHQEISLFINDLLSLLIPVGVTFGILIIIMYYISKN